MELFIIDQLADDIKKDYMINFMSVKDINILCSINKDYSKICNDEELWIRLIYRDFGFRAKGIFGDRFNVIIDKNKPRYFYRLYQLFTKIKILDRNAIEILIDILIKTNIYLVSGLFQKFLIYKNSEQMGQITEILENLSSDITQESNSQYIPNKDSILELIDIYQHYIRKRQSILFAFKLRKNGEKLLNELNKAFFNNKFDTVNEDNYNNYISIDSEFIDFFNSQSQLSFWSLIKLLQDNYIVFRAPFIIKRILSPSTKIYIFESYQYFLQLIFDVASSFFANNLFFITFTNPMPVSFTLAINHISILVIGRFIDDLDTSLLPSHSESISKITNILLNILNYINNLI